MCWRGHQKFGAKLSERSIIFDPPDVFSCGQCQDGHRWWELQFAYFVALEHPLGPGSHFARFTFNHIDGIPVMTRFGDASVPELWSFQIHLILPPLKLAGAALKLLKYRKAEMSLNRARR